MIPASGYPRPERKREEVMSAHGLVWRLAILPLVGAMWVEPAVASAGELMCQIRGSASGSIPPVSVAFQALVAGGAPSHVFHWDFGDGGSASQQAPTHIYTATGTYLVILTVTDAAAPFQVCRDSTVVPIGVIADPFCGVTASTRWGDAPLAVQFTAYPGLVGDPEPYTWNWRFGDGATSTLQWPAHTYDVPGTYYAVATLHTPLHDYDCFTTQRISALEPEVADVGPSTRDLGLRLEPPRPNPFGTMTALAFVLPRAGHVRLAISDPSGRSIAILVNGYRSAGRSVEVWQGRVDAGHRAPPGLYFVSLEHEGILRRTRLVRL